MACSRCRVRDAAFPVITIGAFVHNDLCRDCARTEVIELLRKTGEDYQGLTIEQVADGLLAFWHHPPGGDTPGAPGPAA